MGARITVAGVIGDDMSCRPFSEREASERGAVRVKIGAGERDRTATDEGSWPRTKHQTAEGPATQSEYQFSLRNQRFCGILRDAIHGPHSR